MLVVSLAGGAVTCGVASAVMGVIGQADRRPALGAAADALSEPSAPSGSRRQCYSGRTPPCSEDASSQRWIGSGRGQR